MTKIRKPVQLVSFCDSEIWSTGSPGNLRKCPENGRYDVDYLSFRHKGRMGILCLDVHVELIGGKNEFIVTDDSKYEPIDRRFAPTWFASKPDGEPAYQ